jgi:hypothetical protein
MPALGAIGFGLLVYLVVDLGPARIAAQLRGLGGILPAVLVLAGAKYVLQTAGWRLVLPPASRPGWPAALPATITGDALGYLTWAGPFTGEPIRAVLVRGSVPLASGVAAGAIERAVYLVTAAMLVAAVGMTLVWTTSPRTRFLTLALTAIAIIVVVVVRVVRPASDPNLAAVDAGAAAGSARKGAVRAAVRELWRDRPGAVAALTGFCLAQHALLVAEAYLMLRALGGAPTLATALIFEALTKVVNAAGTFVPGRLGVSEGGSALLADSLGFAASFGVSLALMRRVRALTWAGIGLILLPWRETQARRGVDAAGGSAPAHGHGRRK